MKQSADLQGFIRGKWNWPISCLNDTLKPRKGRGLKGVAHTPDPPTPPPKKSLHLRLSFRKSVSIYPRSAPDVHVLFSFAISARPPCHTGSIYKATRFTSPPNRPNHSRYGEFLIFTRCLLVFHWYNILTTSAYSLLILGNQAYHSAPLGAWVSLGSQK